MSLIIRPYLGNEISPVEIYKYFIHHFKQETNRTFDSNINEGELKKFIYTLIYYFTLSDNFNNSPLLYLPEGNKTKVCLKKGLCIFGGFGTGKTITFKILKLVYEKYFYNNTVFKYKTSKEIVSEYEQTEQNNLDVFYARYNSGFLIIDDIKAESVATRYGKKDIINDILYNRFEDYTTTTILVSNYGTLDDPSDMNIDNCIDDFSRYDNRIVDRLYGRMNFVKLNGKSIR